MRLRVLLTNGSKTIDFLWLRHDGSDIYYGVAGAPHKFSYHASGSRHLRGGKEEDVIYDKHYPLKAFTGHLLLTTVVFHRDMIEYSKRTQFTGRKSDAALYLDCRTLPDLLGVSFGLLELGNYGALPSYDANAGMCQLSIFTDVSPWIYLMVTDSTKKLPYSQNVHFEEGAV